MTHKRAIHQCGEIRELLYSYVKGDVSPVLSRKVDQHLLSCAGCRNELNLLTELQRLDHIARQGAIDPALMIETLNCSSADQMQGIPTVKEILDEIEIISRDSRAAREEKTRRMLAAIHSFLIRTRAFLQSRSKIRAGREWIKLEKRRASLLQKILNHSSMDSVRPVIGLQAEAYVSRGLIFQIQGDTRNAETALSLSVVFHWALNVSDDLQTQRFLGELKYYEGDLDAAEYLFLESLKNPSIDPREQTVLLRNLGNIEYSRGNLPGCRSYLEQAMTISLSLGIPEFPARDLLNLSVIDFTRGSPKTAEEHCREALQLLTESSNLHLKGQLHANLGTFLMANSQLEQSNYHRQLSLDYFRKGYFLKDAVQVIRNIALTDYESGYLERAASRLEPALRDYPEDDALKCQLHILQGRIFRLTGDIPEAAKNARQAELLAAALGETLLLDAALLEQVFIALAEKRTDDLENLLRRTSAVKQSKQIRTPSIFDLENECGLVDVFRFLGDRRAAGRSLRRFKRMLRTYRRSIACDFARERNAAGEPWLAILARLEHPDNNI